MGKYNQRKGITRAQGFVFANIETLPSKGVYYLHKSLVILVENFQKLVQKFSKCQK